jgi:putative phage-type endonuclease
MITEQQRQARTSGIFGSDAAAICGKSPWKTPMDIWLEKTGRVEPEDISDKAAVKAGNYLEPVITKWFTDENPHLVVVPESHTFVSPMYKWMQGHLDGIIYQDEQPVGVFEAKTTNAFNKDAWDDRVPDDYLLQVTHYMAVSGLSCAHMAVLIGGNDFRQFYFKRNMDLENLLVAKERHFWEEYVLKDIAPPLKTEADAIALYPESVAKEVMVCNDIHETVRQLRMVKAQIKDWESHEKALRDKVCAYMGDADMLVDAAHNPLVTWRSTKGSSKFDEKMFAREQEETYLKYIVNVPGHRRMLIKDEK